METLQRSKFFNQEAYLGLSLYYRIWVDCIKQVRLQPANKHNWPIGTMFAMTMAMTFNLLFGMTVLEKHVLKIYFYKIEFSFLPERLNNLVNLIFLFILPCLVINYLLIFRNKRYEKLLKKYPFYKGNLFLIYFISSMALPIVLLLGGVIYDKIS